MRKLFVLLMATGFSIGTLTACSKETAPPVTIIDGDNQNELQVIETLSIGFVPSKEPEQIVTATEPLKEMLKAELLKQGFKVEDVKITVGTSYEAVGEALSAGTVDVGLIPGGTYVLYDQDAEVILTATRAGLNKDFDNPKDWNDGLPTEITDDQANSYRSLIISGPSEKGKELAAKVNAGEELTWEDLDSANWTIMSTTSPAGYIYPSLWLQDKYNHGLTDLSSVVQSDSYGSAMARLASGQIDIVLVYADARRDYEDRWINDFNKDKSIWEETNVIGVTAPIYNDTVSVSKYSDNMEIDGLQEAIEQAFINIGNTPEGKEVIAIYSHDGYQTADPVDYNEERKAQELIRTLSRQ